MKTYSHFYYVISLILCIGIAPYLLGQTTENLSLIEARIVLSENTIKVGAPLLLRAELKNIGNSSIPLDLPLQQSGGAIRFQISKPDGNQKHFTTLDHAVNRSILKFYNLNPGETYATHLIAMVDNNGSLVFDQPGRYELQVVYKNVSRVTKTTIISESSVINVSHTDTKLANFFQEQDLRKIGFRYDRASRHEVETMKQIYGGLPEYRDAFLYTEGYSLLGTSSNSTEQKLLQDFIQKKGHLPEGSESFSGNSAEDVERGEALLYSLIHASDSMWREVAIERLADYYIKTGNLKKADDLLSMLPDFQTATKELFAEKATSIGYKLIMDSD